jgi:hypothetical protein
MNRIGLSQNSNEESIDIAYDTKKSRADDFSAAFLLCSLLPLASIARRHSVSL